MREEITTIVLFVSILLSVDWSSPILLISISTLNVVLVDSLYWYIQLRVTLVSEREVLVSPNTVSGKTTNPLSSGDMAHTYSVLTFHCELK